jgi:hypothetical protein
VVPSRTTGIAYRVRYGIHIVEAPKQGRAVPPAKWAKCSVQLEGAGQLPDGSYFLYTDEGQVHQLKSAAGKWHCLNIAA